MTDQLSGSEAAKAIGHPLEAIIGWLAGLLPEGPAQTLLYVAVGLCVAIAPFSYWYYLGLLAQGAAPEGSIERQDFDKLRASLVGDNLAARLYAKWLARFLDWIERFFGDAGMADRTLFPHAFGLTKPAPLWTAPAFDRCLFLALIYPIAAIFIIWAISGHVGPAKAALDLKPDISGWERGILAGAIGLEGFAFLCIARTEGWKSSGVDVMLVIAFATLVASAFAVVGAGIVAAVVAGTVAGAIAFAGVGAAAVGSATLGAFAVAGAFAGPEGVVVAFASAVAGAALFLCYIALEHQRQGVFFSLFLPVMTVVCLAGAAFLSPLKSWGMAGPLLLFVGLLTLLNAPFDWASLGLTRALRRRGLELGGWWPYLLAFVDACLAGVIIALLALTMVIGVQAFDELAVHGGGKSVLPLDTLFDGIAKNAAAPEYWWAYALLLSTMIPSLVNLAIGGTALTRGIPGLPRLLLLWTPDGRDVPEYRRPFVAAGLTFQIFVGAFLGIAAQAVLAWGLIFHVMPAVGLDLLDMARAVAAFDLPARVGQVFIGLR